MYVKYHFPKIEQPKTFRDEHRDTSNNPENPNKNACGLAVAEALGVAERVQYIHILEDLIRAVRRRFICRSRKSSFRGKTVGAIRKETMKSDADLFIVRVDEHVLLLNKDGTTLVDTDPRKRDRRKVTHIYGVFLPAGTQILKGDEVLWETRK